MEDPCNLEENFLDDVFTVYLAIEVYVKLDGDFTMLEDTCQGFADHVKELECRFFLLKHLQNVLFEEVLNRRDAFIEPVFGQTNRKLVNALKGILASVADDFIKYLRRMSGNDSPEVLLGHHEQVRLIEQSCQNPKHQRILMCFQKFQQLNE